MSMSENTTIAVPKELRDKLASLGKKDDSFSDIIERLLVNSKTSEGRGRDSIMSSNEVKLKKRQYHCPFCMKTHEVERVVGIEDIIHMYMTCVEVGEVRITYEFRDKW